MSQPKLQPVRGTHDLLPESYHIFRHVVETARREAATYGFAEIATPMFEFSEVFHRTLGETSDVVSKETYTFEDRGGESLTLRPELTAGIARSFISNGLQDQAPCKFFHAGPAFRYERPQKGRQRQFHQIDVEILGAGEVQADIEIIALGWQILSALGLGTHVTLELNSLGDAQSRLNYRDALIGYFKDHKAVLSEDSQTRLEKNPLRILDSKAEQDKAIVAEAPSMRDAFTDQSRKFFDDLCGGLDALGLAYTLNSKLVRGLDYYTHTVFEFTTSLLGSQNTVLGGGRYDGLIGHMGGPETPGIGFAAGIERLMGLLEAVENTQITPLVRPISLIPMGESAEKEALVLAFRLRRAGFVVEQGYRGNMAKRMKKADKQNACAALILGENELARGEVMMKDLTSGEQQAVKLDALETALIKYRH